MKNTIVENKALNLKTETYVDKSGWPRGEWDNEPDKIHFVDRATDMDCLIVRGPVGGLCGYVAVEPGHPSYRADYNDVNVDVHGGLTYGGLCQEDGHICHTPREGRPHDVYWFGFDCAHYGDYVPGMKEFALSGGTTYRNVDYVIGQISNLAAQLAAQKKD